MPIISVDAAKAGIASAAFNMDLVNYIRMYGALTYGPTKGPAPRLKGAERKGSKLNRGRRSFSVLEMKCNREALWGLKKLFNKPENQFIDHKRFLAAFERRERRHYNNFKRYA